ncbi:MAG: MraZ protein [Deltaproteobacteria bacterium]|nr:MraZ protein [Deltaproteobacteria bacterium]
MFRGQYEHTIDPKGRVSVPSKFREVLAAKGDGRLVITPFENHLMAYPFDEWRTFEDRMASLSFVKEEEAAFVRYLISGAVDCDVDKQGRVLIPPTLRESAGLEVEVVLAGVLKKFEIWDKKRWTDERKKTLENFGSIKGALAGLGL